MQLTQEVVPINDPSIGSKRVSTRTVTGGDGVKHVVAIVNDDNTLDLFPYNDLAIPFADFDNSVYKRIIKAVKRKHGVSAISKQPYVFINNRSGNYVRSDERLG